MKSNDSRVWHFKQFILAVLKMKYTMNYVCTPFSLSNDTFCCRFDWITPEKKHNIDIHILNRSFNIRPQLHTIPASSTHHILQWNQWTRLHIAQMSFCSTLITTIWVRNFILLDFSKNLNIDSLNQTVSILRGYSAITYIYRDLIRIHASNIDQDSRWDYKSRLGKNHVKSVIFEIFPFHFCWR